MKPIRPTSSLIAPLPQPAAAKTGPRGAAAGDEPAVRPPSPAAPAWTQALRGQLPSSEADKLASLAKILQVEIDQLDALLSAVTWGKDEQKGAYAVRSWEDGRAYPLRLDGTGPGVTELPAALIEDGSDDSAEAFAARELNRLMTEVAASRVQALASDGVQPVAIGGETLQLQVTKRDEQRAYAVLDDGQPLHLVWQAQGQYVPAADLRSWPVPAPLPASAARPVVLLSSAAGSDAFRVAEDAFNKSGSEQAVRIKQEPDEADAAWPDKGKRVASDSPLQETGRSKRARLQAQAPLQADAGAQARWDAYRAELKAAPDFAHLARAELEAVPDFTQLARADRLLLQAAAISVPTRMEYEQRDWQARRSGQPLAGQAIIQAHRHACFARLAGRVAGVASYAQFPSRDKARQALDSLLDGNKTAAALYEKLNPAKSKGGNTKRNMLRHFDTYLAEQGRPLAGILADFAAFADAAHAYQTTLTRDTTGIAHNQAVTLLRALCFPELPFRGRVAARLEQPGSALHALPDHTKKRYITAASNFDAFLARVGQAPTYFDDVEGLRAFLAFRRAACAQSQGDAYLKGCLQLWRQEAHPLFLDDRLDAAISAHLGTPKTKDIWKTCARRLAEYAWVHQMPHDAYTRWLEKLDLRSELQAVARWTGIAEPDLRSLISQFRRHPDAPSAGA